jgi:subtilisin family serine protease
VIAVIDDGFDLEHEDLNFWKNRNEIPGNGIDDDNNGYIDDHDGWNAFTANGEIPEKSHGTRVAGVAGAIGNNGIGICGVGWNCLLMPIAGSSTFESTVVAAFSYVYKMRSLYEETNGERGAFIVVTNGSFGVDFGDPENYPVWKMMYDTLGSLGILSSAATMNHPSDVDIVGDVPTNFESDYLIGVTNTTNTDTKYDVAAWGKVSIDLGAPGTGIISTRTNNTYGYSTGTSLAAPQLSGSVGLLFAAAEEQFLEKYEQDPGKAARFLKSIILDNVDTLQGFDTLCVSGGRLNVNKAVKALIAPRIMVATDTIKVFLRPDSAATTKVLLTNLAGFALGFDSRIVSPPDWIYSWTAGGELPVYGQLELLIGLRTDDLDYGTYFSTCEIRDEGGWLIPLVIELTVLDDTKIEEKEKSTILKNAFPNPFTQQINFSISLEEPAGLQFSIYSYSGKLLDRWEKQYYTGEHIINRDTGTLPGGIYIIEVKGDGVSDQLKVVKASR